jgi:hypothetical protein
MGNEEEWYKSVFKFLKLYFQDDSVLILIMPIASTAKLMPHMRNFGMKIEYDFLCDQPHPLTHPYYKNKLVIVVIVVHSAFVVMGDFWSLLSD